jgi:hypothetical protein
VQVLSNFDWLFSSPFVWDHDLTICWLSQADNNEFVIINLRDILSAKSLSFVSRIMSYGFAIDFSILESNDSKNFIHILDQYYSNFTAIVNCSFSNPVKARYFQVLPITYGTDDHETKLLQLAEIYVKRIK